MKGRLVARAALTPWERERMFHLCARHFGGVASATFDEDLEEKNWVLLLESEDGSLAGFSTLLYYGAYHRGAPIRVVYSGDTIVDPAAWGHSVLAAAWIGAVRRLHRAHASEPLWWLLLVSGFRTYRFLPLFWRTFLPRHDAPDPADERRLRDQLAGERLGAAFDPATGVASLAHPMVLRPGLREVPPARRRDPHVACFLRHNPGHAAGDELVCLTRIGRDNLTPAGRRMWRAGETALTPLRSKERAS